jgi:phage repressor protein C with HTH and peptisase S24 domain
MKNKHIHMDGILGRIRELRKKLDLKQESLAQALEIKRSAVSKKETGDAPFTLNEILILADEMGVNPIDFFKTDDDSSAMSGLIHKQHEGEQYVLVPMMQGKVSAGPGLMADNTIEMTVAFRKDWLSRKGDPSRMSIVRVQGDSMEPTLQSGDVVLIDHTRHYIDAHGGIYAIAYDNEIMIKRLQVLMPDRKVKVISDNTKYESALLNEDQVTINGKVIWYGREIER